MRDRNFAQLSMNAITPTTRRLREVVLNAFADVLAEINPGFLLQSLLHAEGTKLRIAEDFLELERYRNIYVLGGGKASGAMAASLEKLLGSRLTAGCVNIPHETVCSTRAVTLNRAGHPVPDESGVEGARCMIELADRAGCDDLVFCIISGGGSSLMPLPASGLTLADKQTLTSMLLRSGATISEMNAVRKHLSGIKGGWLAKRAYPARLINLILSDVIGDPLDVIASGPTVPDASTFAEAMAILQRYDIWLEMPEAARKRIAAGADAMLEETPKPGDVAFARVSSHIVGNNRLALTAAERHLAAAGFKVEIIEEPWHGDAFELGQNLAGKAVAAARSAVPTAVIMGGEATVKVAGEGRGGRNQHAALVAAAGLAGLNDTLVAVLATDGIDGPTDACGALVDGSTLARAQKLSISPEAYLYRNDSYSFFNALGDLVHTGYTGSNVNDVYMILSAGSAAR